MKKIKYFFSFFLPFMCCLISCNNTKSVNETNNTRNESVVDSTAYKRGVERAVEEKLLPKYKKIKK